MSKPPPTPCFRADGTPKKRWATEKAAKFKAEWDEFKGKGKRYIYECPGCGKWHVSSAPGDTYKQRGKQRAIRERRKRQQRQG